MSEYHKSIGAWKRQMKQGGWIGVDLDGSLAHHGTWYGPYSIGQPIPKMLARVKKWVAEGIEVRIVTARAQRDDDGARDEAVVLAIQNWLEIHVGVRLAVTNEKDYNMIELWDDRAVQLIPNTGERADGQIDSCCYNGLCQKCCDHPIQLESLPPRCGICGKTIGRQDKELS